VTRRDEDIGVVVVDDDEREVALQIGEGAPDCLREIALVMALDQVDDRLGVRLGGEGVAVREQAVAMLPVVLDDPVQDDRKLRAVAAEQRVRVRLRDAAVRRPARVAEAVSGGGAVGVGRDLEVLQVADSADVIEAAFLPEGDPGRVVAAVLEALQALEEERFALSGSDVTNDSAHLKLPFPDSYPGGNFPRNAKSPG
jgi:hypothetical protein